MKSVRPKILFWILLAYVVLQFAWWAWHMIDLTGMAYGEDEEFRRRLFMILGEGAVFMVILIVGSWVVYRSWRKELELAKRQENFLMAVTHELKSPLSGIKLSLQSLSRADLPQDKKMGLIENALAENDRLETLVENILASAEGSSHQPELTLTRVDLSDWLRHKLESTHGLNISSKIGEGIMVLADTDALESVIRNLLDNARKYSPEDSSIDINLRASDGKAILLVADQGSGIAPKNHQKVFEPFFREGDERTRTHKGSGLGLYICDRLVRAHEGRIFVDPEYTNGTQIRVELPQV